MYQSRTVNFILSGLLVIFNSAFIYAQKADKANPQLLQTRPQTDVLKAQAEQLVKSLSSDRQKTFKALSAIMAKQLTENMLSDKSDSRKEEDIRQILAAGMDKTAIITNAVDENTLIKNTMYAAMYGIEANLNKIAAEVSTEQHIDKIIREEIANLKDILTDWPDAGRVREVTYRNCVKLKDGSYEIVETTKVLSKDQAETLLAELEDQLETLGEQTQMDNHELQDAMGKQAQMIQLISVVMKSMNDTAKAIIQNMK